MDITILFLHMANNLPTISGRILDEDFFFAGEEFTLIFN